MSPKEAAGKLNPTGEIITMDDWKCFVRLPPVILYIFGNTAEHAPYHRLLRPALAQILGIDPNELRGGYMFVKEGKLVFGRPPADDEEPAMTEEEFNAASNNEIEFF